MELFEDETYAVYIKNHVKTNKLQKILEPDGYDEDDEEAMAPNVAEEYCGIDTSSFESNPLGLDKPYLICDLLYNDLSYGYMVIRSYHGCIKGLLRSGKFTDDYALWLSDGELVLTTSETILDE